MVQVRLSDPSEGERLLDVDEYNGSCSMTRYTYHHGGDRRAMLDAIGVGSVDELFERIPEEVRLRRPLDLPPGMAEQEVSEHLATLAARNLPRRRGGHLPGRRDVRPLRPGGRRQRITRSEFLTPYTPYQPEISQGGLQAMFEYQTAISELTGLPVSNASLYEGPSSVAAAGLPGRARERRAPSSSSPRGVHPHSPRDARPTPRGYGAEVVEVALDATADRRRRPGPRRSTTTRAPSSSSSRTSSARSRTPAPLAVEAAKKRRRSWSAADPITLGALAARRVRRRRRGRRGPAARQPARLRRPVVRLLRRDRGVPARMPGRIAARRSTSTGGAASCSRSRRASSTSAARRRPPTSARTQALNALAGVVYLAWLGRHGIVELGELTCSSGPLLRARAAGRARRRPRR